MSTPEDEFWTLIRNSPAQIALGDIGREPRPKEMVQIMADMETKHGSTLKVNGSARRALTNPITWIHCSQHGVRPGGDDS